MNQIIGNFGKVMIIDDEESLRSTLTRVLQSAGIDAIGVSNGDKALDLLDDDYHLIFLDIHLPQMDGIEMLRIIRHKTPKIAVIMLTGFGSLQSAVDSLRLGAIDYLTKPINPDVLLARTRIVLTEQKLERRKEQIRDQIRFLQSELQKLENTGLDELKTRQPNTSSEHRFLRLGCLILDLQTNRATLDDKVLDLPPASFEYLAVLIKRSPEIVDYWTLVTEAQQYQVSRKEARELSKWHIHVLRTLLEPDPQKPCHLINVRGKGYRLIID